MSDYLPVVQDWPAAVSGDKFPGFTSFGITVNGSAPAVELARVRIHFLPEDGEEPVLRLDTADASLVITSAAGWVFSVPGFVIGMPAGTYVYDVETVDANGDTRTYAKGSWVIAASRTN